MSVSIGLIDIVSRKHIFIVQYTPNKDVTKAISVWGKMT